MFVHAFVAAVGTGPEPTVFAVFDCFDEEFADFVCGSFGVAVFAGYDLAEFFCTLDDPELEFLIALALDQEEADLHPNHPCYLSFSPLPHLLPSYLDIDSSSPVSAPPINRD